MLSDWPAWRRISTSALFCLCVAVLIVTVFRGLVPDYLVRLIQGIACVVGGLGILGMVIAAITTRLADYQEPADEEEFELLVRRTEQLAKDDLAAEPDEEEFLTLDPRKPEDFEELVREALDDLPDLLRKALDHVAVVISDKGRRHRAYGLYQGDTVARDNYPDRSSSSATRCCATSATTPTSCARRSPAPSGTSWPITSAPTSSECGSWAFDDRDDTARDRRRGRCGALKPRRWASTCSSCRAS